MQVRWGSLFAAVALACAALPPVASAQDAGQEPVRVLVFSKAYGFAHSSIGVGAKYLQDLRGPGYAVVNSTEPAMLNAATLSQFDVLVWNNSTGNVPLSAQAKRELLDWVRAGHGFVGIHSSGDSNYSWPEFAELNGGHYSTHIYKFGGFSPEATPQKVVQEDPDNPLMDGVPANYVNNDETYRWQTDPRPDVHVLMSMDNTSIWQGTVHHWRSPLTWCRPFGAGRTWYTNMGHGDWQWSDPVFTQLVRSAIQYTAGRLDADCSVPADPYTGVKAAERMPAVFADHIVGPAPEVSNYSGGAAVLTKIAPGATVTWHGVDLTGVKNIDVFAAAQTLGPPNNDNGLVGSTPQGRARAADGGPVEVHLDSATGPLLGTVTIPRIPGYLDHIAVPEEAALAYEGLKQTAWQKLTPASFATQTGVHDLVLTFPGPSMTGMVGSLGWIRLVK